mmetsp:Transcript_26688/g.76557  ORF Transcript_26688/g.76557 Transcript_26688/m.76557 type:complete len:220 (-) Transcript_26688:1609-2268(-)
MTIQTDRQPLDCDVRSQVRGTVRDPTDAKKTQFLRTCIRERVTIWSWSAPTSQRKTSGRMPYVAVMASSTWRHPCPQWEKKTTPSSTRPSKAMSTSSERPSRRRCVVWLSHRLPTPSSTATQQHGTAPVRPPSRPTTGAYRSDKASTPKAKHWQRGALGRFPRAMRQRQRGWRGHGVSWMGDRAHGQRYGGAELRRHTEVLDCRVPWHPSDGLPHCRCS